jgi:hypothetical protein
MTIEKQLLETVEPLIDEIVSVNKRIDELTLEKGEPGIPGVGIKSISQEIPEKFEIELDDGSIASVELPSGQDGQDGERGEAGEPGAGIDTKSWEPGVYRQGSIVQHNIGQYFKALKDTAEDPNESLEWERIGGAGFRFAKSFKPENIYQNGDLFVKEFGLFGMFNGEIKLLAGRGPKGEKGETGKAVDGKDGKDGCEIVAFESNGLVAALLTKDAAGDLKAHSIDFAPVIEKQLDELRKEFGELSYDEVSDVVQKSLLTHEADSEAVPMRFYRNLWDMGTNYAAGDVVTFGRKIFIAKESNSGQVPQGGSLINPLVGSKYWIEVVVGNLGAIPSGEAGGTSTPGPAGPAGPAGPPGPAGADGKPGADLTAGAYLPLAGGNMTGPIGTSASGGTVMSFMATYSMFTGTGGVSFRYGATDLIAFNQNLVYAYKAIQLPATGAGIVFGPGGADIRRGANANEIEIWSGAAKRATFSNTAFTYAVPLVLPADPTADLQAATKKYVDTLEAKVTALEARITALETP